MIAEGGTEHFHAVTVSRSRSLTEPFENFAGNPILTHRHLGRLFPICNVGHADMIELPDGNWYMVCLGSRLVEWSHPAPACLVSSEKDTAAKQQEYETDDFTAEQLGFCWNYLGTPYEKFTRVADSRLFIRMKAKNMVPLEYEGKKFDFFARIQESGDTKENMPFLGRRIPESDFLAEAVMEAQIRETQSAGMVVLQNNANQLRLEAIACKDKAEFLTFCVVRMEYQLLEGNIQHYEEKVCGSVDIPRAMRYTLKVKANGLSYAFSVVTGDVEYSVAEQVDASHLGSESAGGFVGVYIGMFATGNGTEYESEAAFDRFSIRVSEDCDMANTVRS